ncbi:MAG: tetratricopeptide repeat protein [Nitrospirota bacterium]
MARSVVISAALFLMTLAVFSQVRIFNFVNYDDNLFITENPYVRDGLTRKSVTWAFTTPYTGTAVMPLAWLSHMLDITLYGLKPAGHHMTNVLIHAANTVLVFIVLDLMTGLPWRSAFVAALFSVHPLHVEAVAWVSERKGLLSAFFWLSTMWCYVYYVKKPSVWKYLSVIVCFSASLLSKPIAIVLPVVLALIDYWPLKRKINRQIFMEKTPLFLLSVVAGIFTYRVQRAWNVDEFFNVLPFTERLSNAFISYVMYLYKTLVPLSLSPIYIVHDTVNMTHGILAAVFITVVSAASIILIKRSPYFFVGWFWYLTVLMPVAGLAQVGYQAMADRYAYLPLIGIFIIISQAVGDGLQKAAGRVVILSISVAILTACTYLSIRQTAHWRDDISLFSRAASVTQDNFIAYFNLGSAYLAKGNEDEALSNYKKSIAIKPSFEKPYVNAGFILLNRNKAHEASLYFAKASELDPGNPASYHGMGLALMSAGRREEALNYFRKALAVDPNFGPAKEYVR